MLQLDMLKWILFPLFIISQLGASEYHLSQLKYIGFNPTGANEALGLESILRGDEYQYGIPEKVFKMNFARFSSDKLWELGNIPSPSADQYLSDFTRDVDGFSKLPLGLSIFERSGEKVVNTNCFSCHAGVVAGQVIAGMPSNNFDANNQIIQTDLLNTLYSSENNVFQRIGRKVLLNSNEDYLLKEFMKYYNQIVKPASRDVYVRGDSPGPWVVWYTLAKMNDGNLHVDLKKSDFEKQVLDLMKLPNVNPSPWWNLKYKKRSFWNGDVSHLSPTTFSLNLLDHSEKNIEDQNERLKRTQMHLDFARSIESPKYPFKILEPKAKRGYEIFNGVGRCYRCHGDYTEYGELIDYPERSQKDVGTDLEYSRAVIKMEKLVETAQEIFKDNKSYFAPDEETVARKVSRLGYIPPPLKGIWASAPYFHNGSVPTLEGVLNSQKRPNIWQANIDPFAYNQVQVGLVYKDISQNQFNYMYLNKRENSLSSSQLLYRRTYNTKQFGRSNLGHTFGDQLTDKERADLIEYLKIL